MITLPPVERQLALFGLWGLLGSFGGALLLTGLSTNDPAYGTGGSLLLAIGYFLHVLVNWFAGFRKKQAFVSFRWFWALVAAFVILANLLWLFG